MRRPHRVPAAAAVVGLLIALSSCAVDRPDSAPEPTVVDDVPVATGDDVEVHPTFKHDSSPALATIDAPLPALEGPSPATEGPGGATPAKVGGKSTIRKKILPHPKGLVADGALQKRLIGPRRESVAASASAPITPAAPTVGTSFDTVGRGFSTFSVGSAPPDPNSAVGPTQIVTVVNTGMTVQSKTGTILYGPAKTNAVFVGFGGFCESTNDGDAVVRYDRLADRWVLTQFANVRSSTGPYYECVAVSQTNDATGTWNRYAFEFADFPDYPKLSVWPDAYYITYNMFSPSGAWRNAKSCAMDRAAMLAGTAATQVCFNTSSAYGGLLAADLDSPTAPPAGAPNVHVALGANNTTLAYWKFKPNFTTPASSTFTGPVALSVAAYSVACGGGSCIPQSGTTNVLDSLGDRLMFRLPYWNFGTHQSLAVSHAVTANGAVGVRWYELRLGGTDSATPSVHQQGTFAPDSQYRFMSSIAFDEAGNIALGYSRSSSSTFPSIGVTGRLAGNSLGLMTQGETIVQAGGGSQTGSLQRWGDYSSMNIDPVDDCTFWFTTEYLKSSGTFNWSTRVSSFKLPGCDSPLPDDFSLTPTTSTLSTTSGGSAQTTINSAITYGSAQSVTMSASGLPTGATATFGTNPITSGGSTTLTINTTTSTPGGTYTITVTGTGAQSTQSINLTLTVSDFTLSLSPTSGATATGGSASSTVSVGRTGTAQSVSLSATGMPTGVTASFGSTTINSGTSTALTLAVAAGVTPGTYPITLTAAGATRTRTATFTLTVNPPVVNNVLNPGFEAGSLANWIFSGRSGAAVSSPAPRTGSFAARLGNTLPTNGDSKISQTVVAPAGATRISFWYNVRCLATVSRDWATATLYDASTRKTTTILAKTCSNSNTWRQVTATVVAGRSYTLTLLNRDDNAAATPTYTLFDDVTFS